MSGEGAATILRVVASLVVVVVLALIAARLARRAGLRGEGAGLRVIDRVGLTRETAVAVVEVAGRVLVLGTSAHSVSMLAELDPAAVTSSHRDRHGPDPGRVTVTKVVAPGNAGASSGATPTAPGRAAVPRPGRAVPAQRTSEQRRPQRGNGAALDPRTWLQGLDALRELTVRRG